MNKQEFAAAFELANNHELDWSKVDESVLDGCGLKAFSSVNVTLLVVAKFIRWQCLYMFHKPGESPWDMNEVNECAIIAKRKFFLVEDFQEAIRRSALMKGEACQSPSNLTAA
jgi:hypothetical protein